MTDLPERIERLAFDVRMSITMAPVAVLPHLDLCAKALFAARAALADGHEAWAERMYGRALKEWLMADAIRFESNWAIEVLWGA